MKTVGAVMLVVLAAAGVALAGTCPAETYDNYLLLSSCMINDMTFNNFSYTASGTNPVPASSISVSPQGTMGNPGFLFNAPWNVSANQTQDSLIGFTAMTSTPSITDLELVMIGSGFTGTGSVSVAESYCLGDTFADGCKHGISGTLDVFNSSSGSQLTDSVSFAGVSIVDIDKDILLSGGSSGSAEVSGVMNLFSEEVPEPAELSLLGGGLALAGAGLLRRKRGA